MNILGFLKEDNGKLSIKRLIALTLTLLILSQVIGSQFFKFPCSEGLIDAFLTFIALCLGMTYIPTRTDTTSTTPPKTP